MNILFLNPPFKGRFSRTSRSPAVAKGGTFYYPIWLAYGVGAAEQAGYGVQLIDAPGAGFEMDDVFQEITTTPDLVVIDTSTPSINHDVLVAGQIKERFPDCCMVLVGTHPSALPVETMALSDRLDGICVGEYDYTVLALAACLDEGGDLASVAGLVYRQNDEISTNPKRQPITDLDQLSFVSATYRKHLEPRNYFFAAASYPMLMIMSGRGCPYNCFFCVYPQVMHGRRYRFRSPENVVAELAYIEKNFPEVQEVGFEDDCFTANIKRVRRICELILEQKIKLKWYCNVRGNLEYDILKLMKKAGCRLVTVGFESGCQHILDGMHKGEKVENYLKFGKAARRAGVLVHGCIMVGNPGDTAETLHQSYEFAKKINCDSMQFYPLYVYPGTEAYAWAVENNYLTTTDFDQWLTPEGLHNCVLDIPELSSAEMVRLCDLYLQKYHLRPAYLFKKMVQAITHPAEGLRSLKSARFLFAKMFAGQLRGKT